MSSCASDITTDSEALKRFNRARDFFGDTCQRHKDRLILEQSVWSEEYTQGRLALILDCDLPVVSIHKPDAAGFIHGVASPTDSPAFIVLKADIHNRHKLQRWDEKLMFVANVHLVQSPEGVIPSRVGFYGIDNKISEYRANLLLFESTAEPPTYKFFPRILDGKVSPFCDRAIASRDDLVVHEVKSTSKIVEGISSRESDFIARKQILSDIDAKEILAALRIIIDARSVTVRVVPEGQRERVYVRDVLVGPLNLFV
jgi:hypothetical protein